MKDHKCKNQGRLTRSVRAMLRGKVVVEEVRRKASLVQGWLGVVARVGGRKGGSGIGGTSIQTISPSLGGLVTNDLVTSMSEVRLPSMIPLGSSSKLREGAVTTFTLAAATHDLGPSLPSLRLMLTYVKCIGLTRRCN